ncbi:MAG: TonB-dependent receptor [Terracidiphilus sp.]
MKVVQTLRKILLYSIALTIINPASLIAQSGRSSAISGAVEDVTGAVLPGATVALTFLPNGTRRTATTGPEGGFLFDGLNTGSYRLSVNTPGFSRKSEQVTYQGTPIHIEMTLAAAGAETQVVVSATNDGPTEPAHVDIAHQEIDRLPTESVSSPLSSLITMTTPGAAADSNGSFHPLGDHAEVSFDIDGQPITDQQSRTFSTQISLNALQSIEVREGAPGADVGDKTSMVVVARTRSGLGQRTPHGSLILSRGTFSTSALSGNLGFGTSRFGTFTAIDTMNSGRFLDAPETMVMHANGNAENLIERLDYEATEKTRLQLNTSLSRSWFQTPNTFEEETRGQNQRQTVVSFNVAPQFVHTFNNHALDQTNFWVRQDKIRYRPSQNILSDAPAYLEQARRLTNAGLRSEFTYNNGRHDATAGIEFEHTFLAERFATGLTDPTYNSPCLGADSAPSTDTEVTDSSQCAAADLIPNSAFLPGLLSIDLTRGGKIYDFQGSADIKQEALFAQDFVKFGSFTTDLGLRFDKYNGLARNHGLQPRVGLVYSASQLHTSIHVNYSRVFITPYNENLVVASSDGPGSVSASLGAADSAVLNTGHRNQFNVGFDTALSRFSLSGEYLWKFTYGAYDFDVLLNSPLTFPTQFRKSKIDGALVQLTLNPAEGFSGFFTVSHVRSRLFGPEVGGISFSAPYSDVARPDHDEGLAMNLDLRYQLGHRGPWINGSYRYDGGMVAVAVPTVAAALRLTGDEQQQMGLHCGSVFASVSAPIRSCSGPIKAARIRIPQLGMENDDTNPPRIAVRNTVDLAAGMDDLIHHERHNLGVRVDVVNLTNTSALYNFLSTFSGTHFLSARAVTVGIRYLF